MTAPVVRDVVHVMGTVVTIDVFPLVGAAAADQPTDLRHRLAAARSVLERADEVFSTWRPDSPVSRLRRGEITTADAPTEVSAVLTACATARELSSGWFDPWAMPGGFDPTGYVKGWAAQRALEELAGLPISGAMVNAAGDIAGCGTQPSGAPFRIGIANPAEPRRLAEIVELTACIATSGTYERGSHLIDPRSGKPAARVASASVTGPDLGLADALATAVAVAGPPGLAFIEPLAGYEALVIGYDGSRQRTSDFPIASTTAAGW
jgi:FAD:protein FMN transferase